MLSSPLAGDSKVVASSAGAVDFASIIANGSASVVEDAHHWLALAACRVGVNHNPTASSGAGPVHIPYEVGQPLLHLSQHLHREPGIGYAGLVLDNCAGAPEAASSGRGHRRPRSQDWHMQRTVTSAKLDGDVHAAEAGFYQGHCAVEEAFADVRRKVEDCLQLAAEGQGHDWQALASGLRDLGFQIRLMIPHLKNMRHFINPAVFASRVRPFLKCGLAFENGLVFDGPPTAASVNITFPELRNTRVYGYNTMYSERSGNGIRGPTGAMTTTLAFIDASVGIHSSMDADPSLRSTMEDFSHFHPAEHRRLLQSIQQRHPQLGVAVHFRAP